MVREPYLHNMPYVKSIHGSSTIASQHALRQIHPWFEHHTFTTCLTSNPFIARAPYLHNMPYVKSIHGSSTIPSQHALRQIHSWLEHHTFTTCLTSNPLYDSYCAASPVTVNFLKDCETHNLREEPWPADTAVREKVYSSVEDRQRIAANVPATEPPI